MKIGKNQPSILNVRQTGQEWEELQKLYRVKKPV